MAQKAVLCGYYGQGNGGDEALLATLLQMLPADVQPIVLSGNPEQTYQQYRVNCRDRRSGAQILQALRAGDVFIWGGGSLMQDTTSWRNPLYYGGLMGLAQQMGLLTIAWAQGIGPLRRPLTRWVTRQALRGCAGISVRDRASAELLRDWQLPCQVAPDPVWALTAEPWTGEPWPRPCVSVTLRPHPDLTPQRLDILTQALIALQAATGVFLLLLPFQASQDRAIAEQIAPQLPGPHRLVIETHPARLKGVFQQVDLAIGMRLHSLIMAAAEGAPCFAVSYDPKVTQLMAATQIPGYELTALPSDAHHLARQWQDAIATPQPLNSTEILSFCDQALIHQQQLQHLLG